MTGSIETIATWITIIAGIITIASYIRNVPGVSEDGQAAVRFALMCNFILLTSGVAHLNWFSETEPVLVNILLILVLTIPCLVWFLQVDPDVPRRYLVIAAIFVVVGKVTATNLVLVYLGLL